MHIPEKYRDRYDRLAVSHPWMRGMRDETETIGDLIEQRTDEIKERNYLIASARNSFKALSESNYDYAKFRKACRKATEIMDGEMGRMGIATDGRTLEITDEPTNGIGGGTNGIADGSPLVDEPPESDAIEHARWRWKYRPEDGDEVVMSEYNCNLLMSDLDAIADMVERDYVPRYMHDLVNGAVDDKVRLIIAERDELKKRVDEQQETLDNDCRDLIENDNEICKLTAERDDLKRKLEILKAHGIEIVDAVAGGFEVYNEAIRERDELEGKLSELLCTLTNGKWSKSSYSVKDMISMVYDEQEREIDEAIAEACEERESERDEWKAKALDYEHRLNVELACSDKSIIEALESERDEWKSKAEQSERAMNAAAGKWAKADEESRELRKMLALDDGTIEEYTERADPMTALAHQKQLAEEWRDRCHNAEAWCDKLESERDEWKAKAEAKSAERAAAVEQLRGMALSTGSAIRKLAIALDVKWNPDNAPLSMSNLQNTLIDLLTDDDGLRSNDGVARSNDGVTNLEWLFEHEEQFRIAVGSFAFGHFSESPEKPYKVADWLMAQHEDANDDSTPDSDVSADDVDANDGRATPGIRKGLGYRDRPPHETTEATRRFAAELDAELDSREKLEADASELVADYAASGDVCDALHYGIIALLDRQASLDRKEFEMILEGIQECMRNGGR